MELKPLDFFASRNPQGMGPLIREFQKLNSPDRNADYGHTGMILDSNGTTAEAVRTICKQNLYEAYKGQKVIIVRWNKQTPEAIQKGLDYALPLIGRTYPWYRIIWHAIGIARWLHILKTPVCSEYTAATAYHMDAIMTFGKHYWGITPDALVDEWRISKHFDIIFEGEINGPDEL